jgi:hypothetical protein
MYTRSKKPVINISAVAKASKLPDFSELSYIAENNLKNKAIPIIADEAQSFWKRQAALRLNTTLESYLKSIVVSRNKDGVVSLSLGGRGGHATAVQRWLAVALEVGIAEFSMKPGYLKGGLRYRVIPLQTKDKGLIFRTVTQKEQATPWAHPGFKPLNLKDLVIDELKSTIIPQTVIRLLAQRSKKKRMQ